MADPLYVYGCRNRPPMMYAVPGGWRQYNADPHPRCPYGYISYRRKLSADEVYRYELIPASDDAYDVAIGDRVIVNDVDEAIVLDFPGPGQVQVQYDFDPTVIDTLDWRVVSPA